MSTINIVGTGGIIEGNLGTANVNVNLDSALFFSGGDGSPSSEKNLVTMGDQDFIDTGSMTLSAWIKPETPTDTVHGATIIGKQVNYNPNALGYALYWRHSNNYIYFNIGDGSNGDRLEYNASALVDTWIHVAGTYNSSTKAMVLYVNGVSVDTGTATGVGDLTNSNIFRLGGNGSGANTGNAFFKGYIADARIYTAVKDQSFVQKLAAKINVDDPNNDSNANMAGWWKSNDGSGSEIVDHHNVGTDFNGVYKRDNSAYSTDIWHFDEYSVDVYDNSTTTDGTFTVTQGKVEGLSLTSLDFDGTDDIVGLTTPAFANGQTLNNFNTTFGAWARHDTISQFEALVCFGTFDLEIAPDNNGKMGIWVDNAFAFTPIYTIPTNEWHHYVAVKNGNDYTLYVDGVAQGSATDADNASVGSTSQLGGNNSDKFFDGDLRSAFAFDYPLSAEQVASLYSGTYAQTPTHWWKMDEGSGTAVEDHGTGTDVDGTITGATYVNGTLDLDGTLTIAANGTLSAPRGNLQLSDDFTIAADTSTFTHNNGTVEILGNVELLPIDYDSSENERHIFYNVTHGSGTWYIERPATIENSYTKTGGDTRQYTKTTFGTATSAGTMTINSGAWVFYGYYGSPTLQGANVLYPLVVTGSGYTADGPIDWDAINNESRSPDTFNYIKWIDFQEDMVTGGNGGDAVLLGDCKFAALTISGGDSLNMNGNRMTTSGLLTIPSAAPTGGKMIFNGLLELNGGMDHDGILTDTTPNLCDVLINTKGTFNDYPGSAFRTLMINDSTFATNTTSQRFGTKTLIGCGELRSTGGTSSVENLIIATGATYSDNDQGGTVEVTGDLNIAGGLIGKSALSFPDGGDSPTGAGNALDVPYDLVNLTGDATIEFWMKADANTNANSRGVINGYKASVANRWQLYQTTSNNLTFYSHDNNKSITVTCPTGKWSHVAIVCTGAGGDVKLYINGKLEGQTNLGGSVSLATSGAFPDFGVNRQDGSTDIRTGQSIFEGELAMLRIWTDERTQSELRANMFATYANLASNTDCAIAYEFDEGTGTDVDDKVGSNNGTLVNSVTWAGAGTFTMGTSTIDFTGNGEWAISDTTTDYYNVKVAASGKTTTINSVGSSERRPRINNLLTHGGGTLTDINNADIVFYNTGSHTAGADLSGLYITYWPSSTDIPGGTYQYLITQHNDLSTTGNINCGGYFAVSSNDGFDLKTHTLTTGRMILYANSTYTMGAGSLIFDSTSGLTGDYTGRTFTAGPGATISGVAAKSGFFSENNYSIVGDISNLDVSNDELTVVGTVTNCAGDIIQFTPGHDTTLSLETDTAEDRDIRLGGPSLDNANHLIP